ncbi:MAG: hypothetical protein COB53_07635 [Elusimicrobia bacterium]|nr:MAG: hypothetical protein COB53_07635 [Elusimicrobiota bacterium]
MVRFTSIFITLILVFRTSAYAEDVAAVLSSNSSHYQKAYEAFRKNLKQAHLLVNLAATPSPKNINHKVIVVFGARAARLPWPEDSSIILVLAPGADLPNRPTAHRVSMLPQPRALFKALQMVRPDMNHLYLPWRTAAVGIYAEQVARIGKKTGFNVLAIQVKDTAALATSLRALKTNNHQVIWLPPDPKLIERTSFQMLKDYCKGRKIPLIAPTASLVKAGADASVSISFAESGRLAAKSVNIILSGGKSERLIHSSTFSITYNPAGINPP